MTKIYATKVFANLIEKGFKTIEDVPKSFRKEVEEFLEESEE